MPTYTPNQPPSSILYRDFEHIALDRSVFTPGGTIASSNAQELLRFLHDINFPKFFSTLTDSEIVDEIAQRSYWHPSGFIRSQLLRGQRNRPEVRLHYWKNQPGETRFDDALHEHPWDSVSIVLEGRILNEFWSISEGADYPLTFFETKDESSGVYTPIGFCSASKLLDFEIGKSQFYWLPSGVFHRSRLLSKEAVTLFVRGPFLRLFSLMTAAKGPATYQRAKGNISYADLLHSFQTLKQAFTTELIRTVTPALNQGSDISQAIKAPASSLLPLAAPRGDCE